LKVALNTITLTPNQKSPTLAINASILLLTLFNHVRVNKTACVIYNNKTTTSKNNTRTLKTAIAHNATRISLFDNQNKVNYKLPSNPDILNVNSLQQTYTCDLNNNQSPVSGHILSVRHI
jgi:hypothetical protein